jgi:hypothetical protein
MGNILGNLDEAKHFNSNSPEAVLLIEAAGTYTNHFKNTSHLLYMLLIMTPMSFATCGELLLSLDMVFCPIYAIKHRWITSTPTLVGIYTPKKL